MEPLTTLLVTAGITGVLYLICIFNFARMGRNMFRNFSSPERATQFISDNGFGNGFAIHVISGGLASFATLATIASFIWFLVDKFA